MNKRPHSLLVFVAGAAALAASLPRMARVDIDVNLGAPAPVYVAPAPVYVEPRPAPVYVAPPPVAYGPAPVVVAPVVIGWHGERYWDGRRWYDRRRCQAWHRHDNGRGYGYGRDRRTTAATIIAAKSGQ